MKTTGNTILVTGGTSGIGHAFAEKFAQQGNTVIICGRRKDRLDQIREKNSDIITRVSDIGDRRQREELCTWVGEHYPRINVLVNNAGIQLTADLTKPLDMERVSAEVEINLVAPIHLSSLLASALASRPEAAIINISSGLAFVPLAFMPIYCATKAAIHSLTLSLRYQVRHTSIKVFELIPPSVDTELGHQRRTDKSQTHGGIPVKDFIQESFQALENDTLEAAIGDAKNLREQGEKWFGRLNR